MRLRLISSFIFIVLIAVAGVVYIASQNTASEVRAFMFRGGMAGLEGFVVALEEYYQTNQTWQGVETLFNLSGMGQGMGRSGEGARQGRGQGTGSNSGEGALNQRLLLTDAQGSVLIDTRNEAIGELLMNNDLEQAIPLVVNEQTVGYLLPEGGVGFTRTDETALLNRINQAAITAGLIAVSVSLLLALLLAYRLLRPIRDLTQAANQLAQGDLSQHVDVHGDDELANLGRAFNQMAASLEDAEQSRRAMTADIAHELRNPLAVQRAHLEALQDGIYPLTSENLNPVLDQNYLLNRLVEDLRTLALVDSGQLALEPTPTDLPVLVTRVADRYRPQADAQTVSLNVSASEHLPIILLDSGRVEQVLGNVLSNALRYTPEGGQVDIIITSPAKGISILDDFDVVQITVHDSGPGIPPDALPHLFDRFFRGDHARSRDDGGSGLGLTIAKQLAHAHGGDLTANNHPQGGAVFTLTLPITSGSIA
jgi:signal transduction histidine kinase